MDIRKVKVGFKGPWIADLDQRRKALARVVGGQTDPSLSNVALPYPLQTLLV